MILCWDVFWRCNFAHIRAMYMCQWLRSSKIVILWQSKDFVIFSGRGPDHAQPDHPVSGRRTVPAGHWKRHSLGVGLKTSHMIRRRGSSSAIYGPSIPTGAWPRRASGHCEMCCKRRCELPLMWDSPRSVNFKALLRHFYLHSGPLFCDTRLYNND